MYYDFFGFREPPFSIAPDPRYLYLSDRHKEALAHLMYGVQGQGGFIVITGEVGTGKTTVCRCFIENAPEHVDIALILNPRLSARELLSSICDELEIAHAPEATIKQLVDGINQDLLKAHGAGRHKVLIIDEAQNLSAEVLEQLRLLTNLETAEKKLLQIVLLGQPELQDMLALPELRQLNQRVTARYHLDAIDDSDLPAYLRYRLSVAGLRGDIFTPGAIRKLYKASHGIPRLINLISDRALLGAYAEGEHQITSAHIRQAAREVHGNRRPAKAGGGRNASRAGHIALLAVSVLIAVTGALWLFYMPTNDPLLADEGDWPVVSGVIERVAGAHDEDPAEPELPATSPDDTGTEPEAPSFDFQQHVMALPDAFGELFDIWGEVYNPSQFPVACEFARTAGLGCLARQGSRRSLEFVNRPAILQLRNPQGDTGYVVIRSLSDDKVVIELSGETREMPFGQLEPYWFGEFRVLWRTPEYTTGDGFFAGSSGEQLWMDARMMQLADRMAESAAESARVKRLTTTEQVRWYQEVRGLTVDGIAGPMTIIQINNDLGTDVPRLVAAREASNG
ncbi:ExeA family protein [Marinobacter halophilus]|uniref:Peptidoglycan-binding protein n=1 Tax=Marinobacter halophilus TaxID=1323740 RepID=A0A2T1K8F5_9GAMM|nr:ExeA family protein [Marinobacter halophilus]PSF06424.1 peptidoglycan-binding protein [Marinobacter halophilus]GGC72489.1 ATPase AAA [Marinobacter halophilus]